MPRPHNADVSRSITSYVTSAIITRRLQRDPSFDMKKFAVQLLWAKTALHWRARVRSDWGW